MSDNPVSRLLATARGDAVDDPFRVTGVMMQYYYVCERELWFESRNVEIDRENASVARGTRVDESSYGDRTRENPPARNDLARFTAGRSCGRSEALLVAHRASPDAALVLPLVP